MEIRIVQLKNEKYNELIEIWEGSVRATHQFLPDDFIPTYKPLILAEYFDLVNLYGLQDDQDQIVAFSGVLDGKLEMLFVHPNHFGKGLGKVLLSHAIKHLGVTKVDVNEQNEDAVGFYLSQGFVLDFRSALDDQGNPYPILHLKLAN